MDPVRATEQLLSVEQFVGAIWDPCCGQGNVLSACLDAGYQVTGTDILRRHKRHWFLGEINFLTYEGQPFGQNIICNPPYFRAKGTEQFIRKALSMAKGKVCVFADIRFLAGAKRAGGLFTDFPPHRIYVITPRVSCPPGVYLENGGTASGGRS